MKLDTTTILSDVYNLILNPHTRDFERSLLTAFKDTVAAEGNDQTALAKLEIGLRPLASRNSLTPEVADFYQRITDGEVVQFDFEQHQISDVEHQERAIFAGGCFWCMVEPFEERQGIISVLSGYIGGTLENPSYDFVHTGASGYLEAVEIIFDTRLISYQELLEIYWQIIDPTDDQGQFQDRGNQYRTAIFPTNQEQRKLAEASKDKLIAAKKYHKPIVTEIREVATFWPAENYHQQFYKKQPKRYKAIERARKQLLKYQK
ncbi:peptide-methionine (S)-S-oxide reductase MsrA [Enterococcus alishanensis]|uniref:Peptide methionine sulfoxide reductase MsrA n=1 Tax=Enterococcus alishanensis TaxID=1303817 RepID=A0ABS6TDF0_9ENTE|nr:peptide-methionine (S)-S-oxide reductase MsrA [Enterococcus alishanensis]MBV7390964.1 peptide-methionine (S)-S-oxide reductase MsrA [Enterococcus alishanensis]